MLNALTIDLEDWYQGLTSTGRRFDQWPAYEDRVVANTMRLLEILSRRGVRATFFVLGYVAEKFPELVWQVAQAGHEIGLHSYAHQLVYRMTPEQFRVDVERGRMSVQSACGKQVVAYRAPMFSINKSSLWALELLNELGFHYDSSVFPTRNPLYGFPEAPRTPYFPFMDSPFVEFPLATVRFLGLNLPIAGGFYLRLLPYPLIRWGLEKINREGNPAVIYLHPWDLDPDQPRPNPTIRESFTHYYNLGRAKDKLFTLLGDFQFGPLCDLINEPDFQKGMAHGNSRVTRARSISVG